MPASPAPAATTTSTPPAPCAPGSGRPRWQKNRLFRFFSSVKLAVVLLSVLIIASIAGTLYETSFDAKVARAYIYDAPWFNLWLVLLAANLFCAALSRMPWKRHHTGFLITHLGIITLLFGALIGRTWGIEGTMTLFKGQPPNNQLVIDQHVLRVQQGNGPLKAFPVSIIGRKPSAQSPWTLGTTADGWKIQLVDYAELLNANFQPLPVEAGGRPAVLMRLVSKRLNQKIENWLLADDSEHGSIDLGLASVQLRRGAAPAAPPSPAATGAGAPAAAAPPADAIDESIVAFSLKPGEQVGQPAPGTNASGVKIRLNSTPVRQVLVDWRGATWTFDVDADHGKDQDLSGSGLNIVIEDYWPDFVLRDGKPATASPDPHNPAVLVRVHGTVHLPPVDGADPLAGAMAPAAAPGAENQAIVYCDDAGALTFSLKSSASPQPIAGKLAVGQPIGTGWADWQLEAVQLIPQAISQTMFQPVNAHGAGAGAESAALAGANRSEGVRVRLSRGSDSHEEWVPLGWSVTLPTSPERTQLTYGFRIEALPIGIQLTNFEVERNEGNSDPASFKSTLKVTDIDGATDTGSCSMNEPHNYPGHWWNSFSGLTFKISQASWNPENLSESTVQILRDPGWLFKWVGSLLVCTGVFTLFYLRPSPGLKMTKPTKAAAPKKAV